jgi:ABC-type spermidine/putrescine transport system permease subunit II
MIVPHVICAIALYYVSSPLGLVGSLTWVSVAHATLGLPVVVLVISSTLQSVDPNLERAALGMGCTPLGVFGGSCCPLRRRASSPRPSSPSCPPSTNSSSRCSSRA